MQSVGRSVLTNASRASRNSRSLKASSSTRTTIIFIRQNSSVSKYDPSNKVPTNFPDLMLPNPLHDVYDTVTVKPNKVTPHTAKIVSRNDPSMFEAAHSMIAKVNHLSEEEIAEALKDDDEASSTLKYLRISPKDVASFQRYLLVSRRVTLQTGKGKIHRSSYLQVIGNGDGVVGFGIGKDLEPSEAATKTLVDAVKNLDYVDRFEKRTVWTNMEGKLGGTRIQLRPRPVGFGLKTNPIIHEILKAAGIKDVSAKVWGSRNPINVCMLLFRMLHAGNAPLAFGDGFGGPGRRMDKGSGVRGVQALQQERGRKMVPLYAS
ncbi:hypothetical protein C8Q75DRAFT_752878 [Abortiporus biennis]|nr:hypothetical protein C8Q75DRAFT_752878 [Abortiporus biennis]